MALDKNKHDAAAPPPEMPQLAERIRQRIYDYWRQVGARKFGQASVQKFVREFIEEELVQASRASSPPRDEREEFEKWFQGDGCGVEHNSSDPQVWVKEHVQCIWNVWQARAKLAAPQTQWIEGAARKIKQEEFRRACAEDDPLSAEEIAAILLRELSALPDPPEVKKG